MKAPLKESQPYIERGYGTRIIKQNKTLSDLLESTHVHKKKNTYYCTYRHVYIDIEEFLLRAVHNVIAFSESSNVAM